MSKQSKTAGKTANESEGSFTSNDIIYSDGADRVTIEITGAAFANLKEIAEIFSKWSGEELSPASFVFWNYLSRFDAWQHLNEKKPKGECMQTLVEEVCDMLCDVDNIDALEKAFNAAGFTTDK